MPRLLSKTFSSLHIGVAKTIRYYMNYGFVPMLKRIRTELIWRKRARFAKKEEGASAPFNFLTDSIHKKILASHFTPLVSIIVPCYNHAAFLHARLDSIYNQSYKNFEVILLDDASTDASVDILREYATRYPDKTRLCLNTENSGSPFRQWRKGVNLATGELIHIAESDDTCALNFLETLVPFFTVSGVELAYADTIFVKDGKTVDTLTNYMRPLNRNWGSDCINTAYEYVKFYLSSKNTIPNVSAVLFRKKNTLPILNEPLWYSLKLCGDWIFYLEQIKGGLVAFSANTRCFYRQHSDGSSFKLRGKERYYQEHEIVVKRLATLYRLDKEALFSLFHGLEKMQAVTGVMESNVDLSANFNMSAVLACMSERKPAVAMFTFALAAGGGEIFPITLAGGLYDKEHTVTLLNAGLAPEQPNLRTRLNPNMPCIDIEVLGQPLSCIINALGVDIVHTHHAVLDQAVNREKEFFSNCAHVVTIHGMYDSTSTAEANEILVRLSKNVAMWVYVAQKNLAPLKRIESIPPKRIKRIFNTLPIPAIHPIDRSTLNIPSEAFVLCLVSRALPEKGWHEAVEAVTLANISSKRPIHLLLIGTGEMEQNLRHLNNPCIHLLGFKHNVYDYFAMADIGFLPSRYAGESMPLAVIECLLAGRPVLASNVGEIHFLLQSIVPPDYTAVEHSVELKSSKTNLLAGQLFDLEQNMINTQALAKIIINLAENHDAYMELCAQVPAASKKFNFEHMVENYSSCYQDALEWSNMQ